MWFISSQCCTADNASYIQIPWSSSISLFVFFSSLPYFPFPTSFFTFTLLICESKVHFWTGKYFCHKLLIILHLYPNSVYFGELEYVSYSSGSNTKPQYCAVHDSSMSFNKNIDWINEHSSKSMTYFLCETFIIVLLFFYWSSNLQKNGAA